MCRPDWTRLVCGRGLHQHATNPHELLIRCEYSSHPACWNITWEVRLRLFSPDWWLWLRGLMIQLRHNRDVKWSELQLGGIQTNAGCRGAKYAQTQTPPRCLLSCSSSAKTYFTSTLEPLNSCFCCPVHLSGATATNKGGFYLTTLRFASVTMRCQHKTHLQAHISPLFWDVQGSTRRSPN